MRNHMLAKLASSALVLGVTMVGCKPAGDASRPRSASQNGTIAEKKAGTAADAALTAAQSGDWSEAISQAEAAVALSPRDAGFRAMLADVYLKAGRFSSASSAYSDTLALNPENAKAQLSLALTRIALGRNGEAIATLGNTSNMAAADRGLALALAGDTDGAIRLLGEAAREDGATGRVRQNLALAYALAGDWTQARAIAAQDVAPDELDARMASWAQFASPTGSYDQVATLLGVSPAADPGQPTRLALLDAPQPVQVAFAEPVVPAFSEIVAQPEPVAVAALEAAPVPETFEPAPVMAAAIASVEAVMPRAMAQPLARTMRAAATAPVALKGRYVVQLGAFASSARVEQAWNGAVGRLDRLANYIPASTRFNVAGGSLTRLSVGGFATRQGADKLCESLRRAGGVCFVRATAGDAPVRWASRNTRNG